MEVKKNIYTRLIEFQGKMRPIVKSETADVNGINKSGKAYTMSYDYATLDAIQKAIQKDLASCGLGYYQAATREGLKTVLFTEEGEKIEELYPAAFVGKPQEIGSSVTYAKRYSLTAILGLIIEGEDDDGQKAQQSKSYTQPQSPKQPYINEKPWLSQEDKDNMVKFIKEGKGDIVRQRMANYKMRTEYREELNALLINTMPQTVNDFPDKEEVKKPIDLKNSAALYEAIKGK